MKVEIVSEGRHNTFVKLDGKELKYVKSLNFECEAKKIPTLKLELYIAKECEKCGQGFTGSASREDRQNLCYECEMKEFKKDECECTVEEDI